MKPIPNFSKYLIDEDGNLYSTNYKNSKKLKQLKPCITDGYLQTMIKDDSGKYRTVKIHRLVAWTFLGKSDKKEINHINGIKTDNRACNLEWVTHSENIKHAYNHSLITPKRGALNGNSKLTREQVIEIREYVKNSGKKFYGRQALADKYGVSSAHIKDIVTRRRGIWPEC